MEKTTSSILNSRLKTLIKEVDKADLVLRKESLKAVDLKNKIVEIYLKEDSEFDEYLEKMHLQEFDAKSQIDLSYQYQMLLIPRMIEVYNCMSLLGIEPEFEKQEDKLKLLQVQEDFSFNAEVIDEKIEHSDEDYTKSINQYRSKYIDKLRETFTEDKKQYKDSK